MGRRRSCANRGGAFAEERADDEPVLDRARRPVLFSSAPQLPCARIGRPALRGACGLGARAAGFPGFAQPAPLHRLRALAGRRIPARERIPLCVTGGSKEILRADANVCADLKAACKNPPLTLCASSHKSSLREVTRRSN